MQPRFLKFLIPFVIYLGSLQSFQAQGWIIGLPLLFAWLIIPLLEIFIKPDSANLSAAAEELARKNKAYDIILYLVVPAQYFALYEFLTHLKSDSLTGFETMGRIWVMGMLCGVFGINVGHELGHRVNRFEQFLAKSLLLTSLYMHFFTEHNKGHHKRVATPEDPSSARFGEPVYVFYFRTIISSYFSAWHIANNEMRKKNIPLYSWRNEMIQFSFIQLIFVSLIAWFFGWLLLIYYLIAALIGILLLETVNYIEHYGLQRRSTGKGTYERAMPEHSWNSNHVIGRIMLFELSRHSDHHYLASRKYQLLRHHENSPQMPTGYPGMMILAMVPPLWFYVMNRRIKNLQKQESADHLLKSSLNPT